MRSFTSSAPAALAAALVLAALPAGAARAQDAAAAGPVLKLATVAPEGTPWADGIKQFKVMVEEKVPGKVTIRPFLNGALGDENETVQACQRGQIQGVGASAGALASVVPELSVLELPMLFRSAAEADHILDKVVLPDLEAAFRSRGLVLGFWSENGYRSFGTNYGFVKAPGDLKGHKMRSQESAVHIEMYRAFGASPVPIPVTEVLTSLQTGVIDGYDNTPLYAMAANWTEVTKYYSVTDHIYQPAAIVFNKAFFDGLPKDVQDTILSARGGLALQMRKEIRALHEVLLQNLGDMGVQLYRLTAAERAAFDAPSKAAQQAYLAKASAGEKTLFDKIVKALATYRAGK
jgi:tripartite ATP-independent transporter DctP family solute receptor